MKKKSLLDIVPVTRAERTSWDMNNVLIPAYMVTMASEVDATAIEELRNEFKSRGEKAPSFTALVIKAAAMTMEKNPQANRAILGLPFFKKLVQFKNTNISVAVEKNLPAMPGQAYACPIDNTLDKSLSEITKNLHDLALCDETNSPGFKSFMNILKYVPRPLSLWLINAPYWFPKLWVKYRGCACWVNAPSKAGADFVATTWPWPITFSFGVVKKRPIVVGDKVEARMTIPLVMVFDRRIMGGGPASRIFSQFKEIIEGANFKESSRVSRKERIDVSVPTGLPAVYRADVSGQETEVENISLGGLKILSEKNIFTTNKECKIRVFTSKQDFVDLKVRLCWNNGYQYGLQIIEENPKWESFTTNLRENIQGLFSQLERQTELSL